MLDDFIFAFFAIEMFIKMVAMGIHGKGTYLAETWNRLDCFIVVAGYVLWLYVTLAVTIDSPRQLNLRPLYFYSEPSNTVWTWRI